MGNDTDDDDLDRLYHNDPNHQGIIALARRIGNMGTELKQIHEGNAELVEMLDKRLPTEDEMAALREVLTDKAGREWLRKQLKFYAVGGLGLLGAIYAARAYLSAFFSWLSKSLG